jgi:hypothetical protein
VFEQGGPSEKVLMVDLSSSSDEEGLIPDTSRDEEFTRKLFGNLNRDVLEPSDDGNIIILSDSDEEVVREEDVTDAEATPSSAARIPALTASAATDEDLKETGYGDNSGDKAGSP